MGSPPTADYKWVGEAVAAGAACLTSVVGVAKWLAGNAEKRQAAELKVRETERLDREAEESREKDLRDRRDDYQKRWTDCDEKLAEERERHGRRMDQLTAQLRMETEWSHRLGAHLRLLHEWASEAVRKLTHAAIEHDPVPCAPRRDELQ